MSYLIRLDRYLSMSTQEIWKKIIGCEIEFSDLVHYDKEILGIKHQSNAHLSLDLEKRVNNWRYYHPIELFSKDHIKLFLETSLKNLDVKTTITYGYQAHISIIDDLGFNHKRCAFHVIKNLMDKLIKKHEEPNRKIKKLNTEIK